MSTKTSKNLEFGVCSKCDEYKYIEQSERDKNLCSSCFEYLYLKTIYECNECGKFGDRRFQAIVGPGCDECSGEFEKRTLKMVRDGVTEDNLKNGDKQ